MSSAAFSLVASDGPLAPERRELLPQPDGELKTRLGCAGEIAHGAVASQTCGVCSGIYRGDSHAEPLRSQTWSPAPLGCGARGRAAGAGVYECVFSPPPCRLPGYGHTVPLSDGGKAFCIVYSVIGIPFTLLFLTAVVQRVTIHVTRRPVLYFHIRWGFSKQLVAIVHAVLLGFVTVSCFFFIPAAVFSVLEDDWNFLESFYFCFISLSTIGLGDYVPGEGYNQKFRELYKIGITCECRRLLPGPSRSPAQPRPRGVVRRSPHCFFIDTFSVFHLPVTISLHHDPLENCTKTLLSLSYFPRAP